MPEIGFARWGIGMIDGRQVRQRFQGLMALAAQVAVALLFQTAMAAAQEPYFTTDSLNTGLPARPGTVDLSTPMSTVESFLHHARQSDFAAAAQALDLTDIDVGDQAARGARLAEQLFVVMDRKVVIPWDSLSDRPDGWLAGPSDTDATGRARRSIRLDLLDLGDHGVPLRVNRVKPGDAPPVWLFSRQSVDNVPALFARYGPTRLEQSLPAWARNRAFWGMYLWEVLFVPLMLAAAVALAVAVHGIVSRAGRHATSRWSRSLVRAMKWPATLAATTVFVGYSTRNVLVVSGVVDSIVSPLVVIGYVAAATLAVVLVIDEIFDRISATNPNDLAEPENIHLRNIATTVSAARKFVIVIALLLGSGIVLSSANTFQSLGLSLLASAGALTIILGFAAREVLGNILASVQIALNRSARIGDQLIFEGHFCTVERIHFTYVQLLIWNGNRFVVPVSYFVKDAFENWSIEDVRMIRPIVLTLAQTADTEALRKVFLQIIETEDGEDTGPLDKADVRVVGHDVFGQKVRFELPTANPATGWDIECKMRERLIEEARRIEEDTGRRMLPETDRRHLPDT
ncbi:mechanosensitive ion channel family protein [Sulfitobacter sabulilitoris]|nr:mechanosensitive ion channel domain-containing protein [Sulfitobacter sabulilitoris]